ncbi:hypothetical protein [Caballeronia sp. Lep1P3]|uniref:hypothetical protein n=1 Tax=Caballeronia sp. Lep1P3 TaxID=2878150 RepID=UPI001FD12AFD|nr:hypothetical protein [Caballeronia sp. Lep1P3]
MDRLLVLVSKYRHKLKSGPSRSIIELVHPQIAKLAYININLNQPASTPPRFPGRFTTTASSFDYDYNDEELAGQLDVLLEAGKLPDLKALREQYAPREASCPEVDVQMPPVAVYDELLEEMAA